MMRAGRVFGISAILAAIALGLYLSREPWSRAHEQRARAEAAREEMLRAEADRVRLSTERAKFESPAGIEELARSRGYRRPNERPIGEGR
jgi:hypothetical protein